MKLRINWYINIKNILQTVKYDDADETKSAFWYGPVSELTSP